MAQRVPREVLHLGSGWGAVERARRARHDLPALPAGAPFDPSAADDEQRPWLDLLDGLAPDADPSVPPASYQVGEEWEALLREHQGWLPAYLLGISLAARGRLDDARLAWQRSVQQTDNAWARRALAVTDDDPQSAGRSWDRAIELATWCVPLQVERLAWVATTSSPDTVLAALDAAPDEVRAHPAVRLLETRAAVDVGDLARSTRLLDEEGLVVPNLREGADELTELWWDHRALALATAAGEPVSAAHRAGARAEPVPARYDFRMQAP